MRSASACNARLGMSLLWRLTILGILVLGCAYGPVYGQEGDPDGACPTIMPQPALQTVSGTLASGQFRDWCFSAAAAQVFEFSTCPPEGSVSFPSRIELRNADGSVLLASESFTCGPGARLLWTASDTGDYRVRLRNEGPSGNFTLGYRTVPVPPCEADLTPATDFQTVAGAIAPGEFRDYCFDAVIGRTYDFTTCEPGSADFDTVIEIRDGLGRTVLAYNDDFCDAQSYVSWTASGTGSYRARVYGFGAASGRFDLAYRAAPTPGCQDLDVAPEFQISEGSIRPGEFRDFCFGARPGETYEFRTCPPGRADFDSIIELRSDIGLVLTGRACATQSKLTWVAASAQRWRLRVRGARSTDAGDFALAYRQVPCNPITLQEGYQSVDGFVERGEFVDYCFSATPGQTYEFSTCSPGSADFPTAIEVRSALSDSVLSAATTSCGYQQQVRWRADFSGNFRVRVRGAQVHDTGNFQLAYRIVPPPPCVELAPAEAYQTTRGTLPGYASKDYCFDAQAGGLFEFHTCPPEGSVTGSVSIGAAAVAGSAPLTVLQNQYCGQGQRTVFQAPSAGRFRVRLTNQFSAVSTYTLAYHFYSPPPCAEILPTGGFQRETGTLAPSSYQEYCFDAVAGQTYEFTTCPSPGRSSFFSQVLMRDSTGLLDQSAFDRTSCAQGQRVFFRPQTSGRYRTRVTSGSSGGTYTLAHQIFLTPWVARTPLPTGIGNTTAVAADGLLYLIGGSTSSSGGATNQVWAYDPATLQWTRKADIPVPQGLVSFGSAAALNGFIYVFGGATASRAVDTTWIYDTAADTWSEGHRMPLPNFGAAVAVANGKIYVAGGRDSTFYPITLEYDPEADLFTNKALIPAFSDSLLHAATVTSGGRPEVHVFGGSYSFSTLHWVYDVTSNSWRNGPPLPIGSAASVAVTVDNRLYMTGASSGGTSMTRTQVYEPSSNTWLQGPPIFRFIQSAGGDAVDGVIYLIGGFEGSIPLTTNYAWLIEE